MKIALIGRSEILFLTAELLIQQGYTIKLIVTAKEAPEYKKKVDDFKKLAQSISCCFVNNGKITLKQLEELKEKTGPIDIGISVNYPTVLSASVINCFKNGILNAHGGDLPRYRGNACQAWAIINKEDKIGLCIHRMNPYELDNGDIIAREYLDINIKTLIGQCWNWMNDRIPFLFLRAIEHLTTNPDYFLEKQSSDPDKCLRCYPRLPEDGKINWNQKGENILRLINASSEPYFGAFCLFNNELLKIWRAELLEIDEPFLAIPGQITSINQDGSVDVACACDKIRITEIEYAQKRTSPSTIIKSIRSRLK